MTVCSYIDQCVESDYGSRDCCENDDHYNCELFIKFENQEFEENKLRIPCPQPEDWGIPTKWRILSGIDRKLEDK